MNLPTRLFSALAVLCAAACSVDDDARPALSEQRLAALAALGVDAVERSGDSYVFFGEAGEQVGSARIGEATAESELHGDRVRTASSTDATTLACNGADVLVRGDGVIPLGDATALEPCGEALGVIETLVGAEEEADGDEDFRIVSGCSFLGRNGYCEGEDRVINRDWLCYEDGQYYVISTTEIVEYSEQCLGCCQ